MKFHIYLLVLILSFASSDVQPGIYNGETWVPLNSQALNQKASDSNKTPLHPVSESWKSSSTLIFAGIIDYRDSRCSMTMEYLFSRAKYPDRIRIGKFNNFYYFELFY
jgi:hypothetical protein